MQKLSLKNGLKLLGLIVGGTILVVMVLMIVGWLIRIAIWVLAGLVVLVAGGLIVMTIMQLVTTHRHPEIIDPRRRPKKVKAEK